VKIIALRGDITKVEVDALVNPTDAPEGSGKLSRALLKRGGREVQAEAAARGPLQVGEAILTTSGRLKCLYVIHAPAASPGSGGERRPLDPEALRQSTLAALRCAAGSRLRSVAIPAFSREEMATRALLSALADFDKEAGAQQLTEVFIVGEDGEAVRAVKRFISSGN
jgi:O-acetyl-ADP-ribose deacetylase (regulator of RNase III)